MAFSFLSTSQIIFAYKLLDKINFGFVINDKYTVSLGKYNIGKFYVCMHDHD